MAAAAVASPLSSGILSNRIDKVVDSPSSKSPYTPSPRKLKRLQSAYTDERQSESKCKRCGFRYPLQNPGSRIRRSHKKICPGPSSQGSDEEIEGSGGDDGGPDHIDSEQSFVRTRDHEVTDTAKSRKRLPFDEMEQEEEKGRSATQEGADRAADDELQQPSTPQQTDSERQGSGAGEEKLEVSKDAKGHAPHDAPTSDPHEAHSPGSDSDLESGSDSGSSSSASDEHESDPSYDMPFESSDVGEASKRDDSLPSDDDMLEEETRYGASQHQQEPHSHTQGAAESSRAGGGDKTDSEGENTPLNVANLITKYNQTLGHPSDTDTLGISGNKRSIPSVKSPEGGGPISLRSETPRDLSREIVPEEELLEQRGLSTEQEVDLELLLRTQKTHDIICPVCGSEITDRVIVRKKRRTFSSKNLGRLPALKETTSGASDQEITSQAITTVGGRQDTWVETCFSYLGLFRKDTSTPVD